jgi:chromosome segregation ATPase
VSVDTESIRYVARALYQLRSISAATQDRLLSAAEELEDLRRIVAMLREREEIMEAAQELEEKAHEATKREHAKAEALWNEVDAASNARVKLVEEELEATRGAIAAAYRDASGELTAALNANERLRSELEEMRARLEAADGILEMMEADNTRVQDYFAKYPRKGGAK